MGNRFCFKKPQIPVTMCVSNLPSFQSHPCMKMRRLCCSGVERGGPRKNRSIQMREMKLMTNFSFL